MLKSCSSEWDFFCVIHYLYYITRYIMNKTNHNIPSRRIVKQQVPSVYDDDNWKVPNDYPEKPQPKPKPKPIPPKPTPPTPKPKPVDPSKVTFGPGLKLQDDIVSVKVNHDSVNFMNVGDGGVSIEPLVNLVLKQDKKISELADIIVDLKHQINKLKSVVQIDVIAKEIADKYPTFTMENGDLSVSVGEGLSVSDGAIVVNTGTGLTFDGEDDKVSILTDTTLKVVDNVVGTNVDETTIYVNDDGKLSSLAIPEWYEYTPINN